jgi:competence protein ComEC
LPGLVDGDTSGLPSDVVKDFRTTGLTHIVAVSGAIAASVIVVRR